MNPAVQKLIGIVLPPKEPVGTGSPAEWQRVSKQFGIDFPKEYRELIALYGAGDFLDFIGILSPFSTRTPLFERHEQSSAYYESALKSSASRPSRRDQFEIWKPFGNGLLTIGGDDNGRTLFLNASNDTDSWKTVYASFGFAEIEESHSGVCEFVFRLITGNLKTDWLRTQRSQWSEEPIFVPESPTPTQAEIDAVLGKQ